MARGSNLESIDIRIAKAEEEVSKAKARYEKATANLKDLLDKRDAIRRDQLMQLIADSDRSYDEIVAFLKGTDDDQDAEE
jgi:formiminotetrahydrofolate cyclodeaminase